MPNKTGNKLLLYKLVGMSFLEFAVWGAYLTSMSNYLGKAGMGDLIAWFFAIQGFVCLVMPALIGIIADNYIHPQRLLGICQLGAGLFMALCWWLGYTSPQPDRAWFVACYTFSTMLYMPTVALSNSIALKILRTNNLDSVKYFPKVRVFGTIGFIVAMLFVNFSYISDGRFGFSASGTDRFQFDCWQFLVSAIISFILFAYTFALPNVPVANRKEKDTSLKDRLGLGALSIFKSSRILVFFIFSILMGMCLKVTNGYASPFITSFLHYPEYAAGFGAANANLLTSISQCSEALCILLIPFFMRKYGVKAVFAISMFAWALRFGSFAFGNPGDGMWLLVFSMLVYGIAFDFFNISGSIFLESETDKRVTASAQGLWMMATNGLGASVGTLIAGAVVDHYCKWIPVCNGSRMAYLLGDWQTVWLIFAIFAFITGIAFCIVFRNRSVPANS